MNNKLLYFLLCTLFVCSQCMPFEEEKLTDVNIDFNNELVQKIYNFQDEHKTDSLIAYFNHKDPTFRYMATMAFASVKDPKAVDSLLVMLKDEVKEVRTAAAYAIGQLKIEAVEDQLINAFDNDDSTSVNLKYNAAILEAVGKSASAKYLDALSTIKTFLRKDTILLEGQAWGIYRYGTRGIISKEGTAKMVDFVSKKGYPESVRLIAANYLYRVNAKLDSFATPLIRSIKNEDNPFIKMTLAIAVGKTKSPEAAVALQELYAKEEDYRVKYNILRALGNFEYGVVQATVFNALTDDNSHVANGAAQFFVDFGWGRDASVYWRRAKDTTLSKMVQTKLYQAANKFYPPYLQEYKGRINYEIKKRFLVSEDPYEKIGLLRALAEYGKYNYPFIKDEGFKDASPIVKTTAVSILAQMLNDPDFYKTFSSRATRAKRDITAAMIEAIQSGDVGMLTEAASVFKNPALDYKSTIEDYSFLTAAQEKLKLPKEIETYNALKHAIDYFKGIEGDDSQPKKLDYNHPINWLVNSTITGLTEATIQTDKGDITLRFFPRLAPGSVTNFVQLAKNGFYNGKNMHRVVPNFVVQGGCPRGDGYGGLDYSIRSELPPLHYMDEGYLGMASAGNHTECTQWFITHSPTPHLDGNYTIFGKVTEGMDVVHKIEAGDIIKKITIN